ncbi:16S rRNA (guanine(527)-N(7))-methyltransferase RsmG [Allofustis seminis]|uniref:16S rRNA (guanine(527)-N(7))-methyltransferase RsmG n=1 Tax=Allofustis seminis TaxID=166939 RepID=UPI0003A346D8|nr:16S rRNA (guanine(527)-N(7))-methyltransferase RsmG [Allofustis seminis]
MQPEQFKKALEALGFTVTKQMMDQFARYVQLLQEWNKKINLTAIDETEEIYLKHFYDSVVVARYVAFQDRDTLIDVGSGAGFPSLPLKILLPSLQITIIDSLNKRINFLKLLVEELALDDVELFHGRAEDFGQNAAFRERFDWATARAVARMSVLSEYCLPFVKVGGAFLALKGDKGEEELLIAKRAIQTFGGQVEQVAHFELPLEAGERSVIQIKKIQKTPKKYPRQAGLVNKKPLEN